MQTPHLVTPPSSLGLGSRDRCPWQRCIGSFLGTSGWAALGDFATKPRESGRGDGGGVGRAGGGREEKCNGTGI